MQVSQRGNTGELPCVPCPSANTVCYMPFDNLLCLLPSERMHPLGPARPRPAAHACTPLPAAGRTWRCSGRRSCRRYPTCCPT